MRVVVLLSLLLVGMRLAQRTAIQLPRRLWAVLAVKLLLFPLVHAAPGLLGHRLLERSTSVGDARWRRRDYPGWWFIIANHRMTLERLVGRRTR